MWCGCEGTGVAVCQMMFGRRNAGLGTGMFKLVQWRGAEHVARIRCSGMDTKFIYSTWKKEKNILDLPYQGGYY